MSNRFLKNRFRSIINRYLKRTSTPDEQELVDYFYDSIPDENIPESDLSLIEQELKEGIDGRIDKKTKTISAGRMTYLKVACIIAALAIPSLYIHKQYKTTPIEQNLIYTANAPIDVEEMPTIVLNDGKSYALKDSLFGVLSYRLVDDEKVYIFPEAYTGSQAGLLSQIRNPTDKIFAFLLQDGTTAWLNPNSTLDILPESEGKRMVKIEGTVLFDVQRIKGEAGYKPFVVKTSLQTIEVLGTKFVVNSVGKQEDVLLLEGKVKLIHNNYLTEVILKPNQKASLMYSEPKILVTKSTDSYKVEAWHKGLFHFDNERIGDVMTEISQWYGQHIVVDEAIRDIPITGMISRYKNIGEVLEIIEMTNNIKYEIRDGMMYVK